MTTSGKIAWNGIVPSVQPRIRLSRSFGQRNQTRQGHVLRVRGTVGDEAHEVSVAIGEAGHAKHAFQVDDAVVVVGDGWNPSQKRCRVGHLCHWALLGQRCKAGPTRKVANHMGMSWADPAACWPAR